MYAQISDKMYAHLTENFQFVLTDRQELSNGFKRWYYCEELEQSILVVTSCVANTDSYHVQDINA